MNNLPVLFFGIFATIALSWSGLVLASYLQLGGLQPEVIEGEGGLPQPQARSGLAQQGKAIYIREGCLYCHSQQVRYKEFGSDYARGWGPRHTIAQDYIHQEKVLLGTMRTGPDLTNVGNRLGSAEWHYLHLWDPRIYDTHQNSIMPAYRHLFDVRPIRGDEPSPDALKLPTELRGRTYRHGVSDGYEVVPNDEGRALVAYLLSLRLDYELPDARFE